MDTDELAFLRIKLGFNGSRKRLEQMKKTKENLLCAGDEGGIIGILDIGEWILSGVGPRDILTCRNENGMEVMGEN